MKIRHQIRAQPTRDGDGVAIQRIADFQATVLDPYLMLDELKSDDEADYIGGFPPHPHRGIETFTYTIDDGLATATALESCSPGWPGHFRTGTWWVRVCGEWPGPT